MLNTFINIITKAIPMKKITWKEHDEPKDKRNESSGEICKVPSRWSVQLNSYQKHAIHCASYILLIITTFICAGGINFSSRDLEYIDPFETYGYICAIILYSMNFLILLSVPYVVCCSLGLLFMNVFPEKVKLRGPPCLTPFICFRVITRGDYPKLVNKNVKQNMKSCKEVGLKRFMFEVVTDKAIKLPNDSRIQQIVVPPSYRTKNGSLFKARKLQYCLEKDNNVLNDKDWIVHLDEETIVTEDSIKGIVNFILDGKHAFGQGVIIYAKEKIVNWIITINDCFQVADFSSRLRFELSVFHKTWYGWKGSFAVAQVGAERKVTFDHGPKASITEDGFFCLVAAKMGYSLILLKERCGKQVLLP